ncbi:MAG: HAD family hydrolase [Solidesulfovibrio sp. DCME]|uniref:HAD family hydrolase n=1 Tax=Solidesulfovibrio sp. DCME TaxID=3447380 RepID=UPI003D1381A9
MYVCNPASPPDFLGRVKGVVFDCDGVLVDSRDANRMYYNLIREGLGMLPITPEEEEYVHMHAVNECLIRIIPPERMDEAQEVRRNLNYADIFPYIYLEDGLTDILAALQGWGVRMAVHTNRTTTVGDLLAHFEIDRYFDPVISAGSLKRPKPDPEGIHMILGAWGLAKEAVAYIGDSALDERSARAAGIPFWAFKNPGLATSMYIPDFPTLLSCLRGFHAKAEG